ncbi:MAG: GFA family protein [Ramlibacter sp.]|nr:GFA family protein [Ramlibacter sp.]
MTKRVASCSCGKLTATTIDEPLRVGICHCLACQRRSGSVFATTARFPKDNVVVRGRSKQYMRTGDAGSTATFHFCASCGATVYYTTEGREDTVAIPVGAFAEPGFPAPRISVYEERMHPWVGLPADIEHLA